jgi:uncharacterized protein
LTVAVGVQGTSAMEGIWRAAKNGDLAEVERLLGQDPGLLSAKEEGFLTRTPFMWAPRGGHAGVVRWLLDKGAAINARDAAGFTALWLACPEGRPPVVKLLLERGTTPLMLASVEGHVEVVRVLLGHASARATINRRDGRSGETALWKACYQGRGGVVRALLENGADTTIADNDGTTPMAIAKPRFGLPYGATAKGRRECVAALKVRLSLPQHLLT